MSMMVNMHTTLGASATAESSGDVVWVRFSADEGRCTVSVFMPSIEHAQAVAAAFNAAFEVKQDADQNDVQSAADTAAPIRLAGD